MDEVIEIARRGGGRAENDNEYGDAKDGTDLATHLDDGAAGGGLIRSMADQPQPCWSQRTRPRSWAPKEIEIRNIATLAHAKTGLRNKRRSRIADACRTDRVTNSPSPITLTPKATRILIELQPQPDPCTRARVSAPMATISNSPPQRSGTRVSTECLIFGAKMAAATSAAIPMGMFRTKIHRHDAWTSSPPSAGPAAAPREPLTAQIWMECFPRSAGMAVNINPTRVRPRPPPPA